MDSIEFTWLQSLSVFLLTMSDCTKNCLFVSVLLLLIGCRLDVPVHTCCLAEALERVGFKNKIGLDWGIFFNRKKLT